MYNQFSGSALDSSITNSAMPTNLDFFMYKDLIILEQLGSNNKERINELFKLQMSNYKS